VSKNDNVKTTITADSPTDDPQRYEIREFAQSVYTIEGQNIAGRYLRLEQGPENAYGVPTILVFEGVSGVFKDRDGRTHDIVPGREYALWLIHGVLRNEFGKARPAERELFVVRYDGRRVRKDFVGDVAKAQDKDKYHVYRVIMPEREAAPAPTWGDLTDAAA
jgi:hypothetical protein